MMVTLRRLAPVFVAIVFVLADDFETKVAQLGDSDFRQWREEHPHSFVMFYAPW
jgi:hypothetical protein